MKAYFVILICIFITPLICCTPKNRENIRVNFTSSSVLVPSDIVKIKVDSTASYTSLCMSLFFNGSEELLFVQNQAINGIDIYSLDKRKIVKSITIPKEGPGSIAKIHGFTVISKDSIIVFDKQTLRNCLLVNFEGEFLNTFKINHPRSGGFFNHFALTPCPAIYRSGKIFIKEFPFGIGLPDPHVYSSGYKLEYEFDLTSQSLTNRNITWPSEYHGEKYWLNLDSYFRTLGHENLVVYSWPASDSILVTDFEAYFKKYYAGSRYFATGPVPDANNGKFSADYYVETDQYSMILYDVYREVYYRFVRHGIPHIDRNGEFKTHYDQPLSVVILDKEFNVIGETELVSGNFLPKDCFVGKRGLYISNHNINNKSLDEDFMQFTLFLLAQN